MQKMLVIRFSALGDVAMTIPIVHSFARQHPETQITVVSRKNVEGLFTNAPDNVRFRGVDLKEYAGICGLRRLFNELKQEHFAFVADLHGVLRTHILRAQFTLAGCKTAVIDKGRKEKRQLTRRKNKRLKPLKTSFERYGNVFEKLGFSFDIRFSSLFENRTAESDKWPLIAEKGGRKYLGVAPFAKHRGKACPLEKTEQVIAHFAGNRDVRVFLFGGGAEEKQIIDDLISKYPSVTSFIGRLNMYEELLLMSTLDLILSMDSANMHLASLVGTRVLSVWGATHPYAGFLGWNQSENDTIQTELHCRPCSVFGQKKCYRGDYACMNTIEATVIIDKIEKIIFAK
ncbi:MAG: glycosyltransferase family 9 protein [Prevotellaceae bacterium]|jgi:ADP-heptose:LPS heptosyltransferase|nr:glycosyltransferase family 9 protein [Prevotellaceae bacterium]